ncbi:uncharacterized protein EDB91DRAFT_111176 [Suillus paluster]|uniref:uncharacterized protein n=1 Tax=Suillus paluster TaxID=48578 RepID=UPI001B883E40|nr:uncharacterized protein EDB91DRAFT_111176 [Suillus paluster]KAG1746729.1 hypothetical protein EDB91DRAFT_111176 [Suillus paluster]
MSHHCSLWSALSMRDSGVLCMNAWTMIFGSIFCIMTNARSPSAWKWEGTGTLIQLSHAIFLLCDALNYRWPRFASTQQWSHQPSNGRSRLVQANAWYCLSHDTELNYVHSGDETGVIYLFQAQSISSTQLTSTASLTPGRWMFAAPSRFSHDLHAGNRSSLPHVSYELLRIGQRNCVLAITVARNALDWQTRAGVKEESY